MAKALAGGGGHPNASGGRFSHFKEFYNYEQFKLYFNDKLLLASQK